MRKALILYVRSIDSMSRRIGRVLMFGVIMLVAILLIEAVSRYVFNMPTIWSLELAQFTLGAYFVLAGGFILLRGSHVRMDVLYDRWSPRRRAIFDAATFSLLAVYLIVFVIGGVDSVHFAIMTDDHSPSQWRPPYAPIKTIVVVGAVLLLLQAIALFIRDVYTARGKRLEEKP